MHDRKYHNPQAKNGCLTKYQRSGLQRYCQASTRPGTQMGSSPGQPAADQQVPPVLNTPARQSQAATVGAPSAMEVSMPQESATVICDIATDSSSYFEQRFQLLFQSEISGINGLRSVPVGRLCAGTLRGGLGPMVWKLSIMKITGYAQITICATMAHGKSSPISALTKQWRRRPPRHCHTTPSCDPSTQCNCHSDAWWPRSGPANR